MQKRTINNSNYILYYIAIYIFRLYKLSPICIIIFSILLGFEYTFIIKYLYEVIIIRNKKIVVYVSLFYRHLKFCKLFNSLQVYDIDDLKNIYFKNTTEILVSKVLKRTESPYHKIYLSFKDRSYSVFEVKLKDEVAKDTVLKINKFLEKYKKELKNLKSDRGNIMKNEIKFYENMLTINDVVKEFSTKILQVIEFKNFIVIRTEYNSQISDNIFCINYKNEIIWNISEIIKRAEEAYTGVNKISENIIDVYLFIGICYRIDNEIYTIYEYLEKYHSGGGRNSWK